MARRNPPAPSAPTARAASAPAFRAGELVRVAAGLVEGAVVPVIGPSVHRFGDIPCFDLEFPFPTCTRPIRVDYLERAS